jgi:hypothetical protein
MKLSEEDWERFVYERVEARVDAVLATEAELLVLRRQITEGEALDGVLPSLYEEARECEARLLAIRFADPLTTELY